MEILEFEPRRGRTMEDVETIGAFVRISIMDNVANKVIDRFGLFVAFLRRQEVREIQILDREVDDRRVLLLEESVLREALDVENQILWHPCEMEATQEGVSVRAVLLLSHTVESGQKITQRDLRDDVLSKLVLEQRWRWELQSEVEEGRVLTSLLVLLSQHETQLLINGSVEWHHFARVDLHPSSQSRIDDGRVVLLASTQSSVKRVEEPGEEVDGILLLCYLEPLLRTQDDSLQHLVRRDMRLEVARIPQLANQLSPSLHQDGLTVTHHSRLEDSTVVLFSQEIVPDRRDMR